MEEARCNNPAKTKQHDSINLPKNLAQHIMRSTMWCSSWSTRMTNSPIRTHISSRWYVRQRTINHYPCSTCNTNSPSKDSIRTAIGAETITGASTAVGAAAADARMATSASRKTSSGVGMAMAAATLDRSTQEQNQAFWTLELLLVSPPQLWPH